MRNHTGLYPCPVVDRSGRRAVSNAGGVLLAAVVNRTGLGRDLSDVLAPWQLPMGVHDPGKIVADLAVSLALGGDCLADMAQVRAEPAVFGMVASDPTVSRLVGRLAADADAAVAAIDAARAQVRGRVWAAAGEHAPDHGVDEKNPLVIDVDATLVTAHSEKEQAAATYKRGFGFHPLLAFADHGAEGTGEPLSVLLRRGNAGANTAADHITVTENALTQLPPRPAAGWGRQVLIRTDGAGGTHAFLDWLTGQNLAYSVGFTLTETSSSRPMAGFTVRALSPSMSKASQLKMPHEMRVLDLLAHKGRNTRCHY